MPLPMGQLDHWHPVLEARRLRSRPVGITLAGRPLVLFRTAQGAVGALEDRCVHRRMRLSEGRVEGGCLVCPYHGWRYTPSGQATSPGTPRLEVQAPVYDASVWEGAVWVRGTGGRADFPRMETEGYRRVGLSSCSVAAPLEVVLDNFIEVEHTPTTHALFGYDPGALSQVKTEVELTPESVRVVNHGLQKPLPLPIRLAFGLGKGDGFIDDWTTRFSPVHTIYEQHWTRRGDGEPRGDRIRLFVFFNPIDATTTQLFLFAFARLASWRGAAFPLLRRLITRLLQREVMLDKEMVERIADKSTSLEGMKLSRFDKPLAEARKRIETIYRGTGEVASAGGG